MGNANQRGSINTLLLPLIFTAVLFLGAVGFGVWAYMGRQDYKDNTDSKIAAANEQVRRQTQEEASLQYAEEAKKPLKPFAAPPQLGSVRLEYPKTWSAYVIEGGSSGAPLNAYMHPDVVPNVGDSDNVYALRVQVLTQTYDRALGQFDGRVRDGRVLSQPYTLPRMPDVVGTLLNGEVESGKQGSMVLFPIRNMTLKVWTESNDFRADFDNFILPNLTFAP